MFSGNDPGLATKALSWGVCGGGTSLVFSGNAATVSMGVGGVFVAGGISGACAGNVSVAISGSGKAGEATADMPAGLASAPWAGAEGALGGGRCVFGAAWAEVFAAGSGESVAGAKTRVCKGPNFCDSECKRQRLSPELINMPRCTNKTKSPKASNFCRLGRVLFRLVKLNI
jgi:hypothetical protein